MSSKLKVLSAILLLSLTILRQQTSAQSFNDSLSGALATGTMHEQYGYVKDIWINLRSVQPLHLESTVRHFKLIKDELILNPRNLTVGTTTRQNIYSLYQEIRHELIWSYGRKLAQMFSIKTYLALDLTIIRRIIRAFEYDPVTALKIFEHGISELYVIKKLSEITQYLHVIGFDNPMSWDLKIDCQLFLYFEYLNHGDIDDDYLLIISLYFRIYKYNRRYTLSDIRKRRLDKAVATLPSSLRILFFPEAPVCVRNKDHKEYLFEKNNATNAVQPNIYTCPNQNFTGNDGNWVVDIQIDMDTTGFLIIRASLRNVRSNHYLHRDVADGNKIVASTAAGVPETTGWFNLQFNDGNLMFSQRGFLMCAMPDEAADWRDVYSFRSPSQATSRACQWELVGKCPAA